MSKIAVHNPIEFL